MKATIVWTVLPRGIRPSGELELSIHLSPRLHPDGASAPLSAFAELQSPGQPEPNWASHAFTFGFEIDGPPTPLPPTPIRRPRIFASVAADAGALDPALWGRLFAQTEVRAHTPTDLRGRKIRSFPVGHVRKFIHDYVLASVVQSPEGEPPLADEKSPLNKLDLSSVERRKKLGSVIDARLAEYGYVPAEDDPVPDLDFFQAMVFHGFKGRPYGSTLKPPKVDFHEAVALLADYPALLRKLGLVFDVVVPAPPQAFTKIRVHPSFTPHLGPAGIVEAVTPWTAIDYAAGATFEATPALPDRRRHGFLDLGRPTIAVDQVDVDGGALKMIQHAEASARLRARGNLGAPDSGGTPALRSAGFSVSVRDRAGDLRRTIDGQGALHDAVEAGTGSDLVLHAEEITRGLRIDVLDPAASAGWRSLHRREPTLTLKTGDAIQPLDPGVKEEEGVLTASVTSPSDPAKGDDLYLHETLFHWSGWSLSVERPGKRVDRVGHGIADSANPAENALGLASTYKVAPGSLPRLRFGARYRLRARLVDLAGNSLPWTSSDASAATPAVPYLRFEPVPAPTLSREADPRPGESIDRVVIRSFNATPADDAVPTAETSARGLFPPRCAVLLAEQHGSLDAPGGGVRHDHATYTMLAKRDRVQPPELTSPPTAAEPLPLAQIRYLPDPLAAGIRLAGLPGSDEPLEIECAQTWPETRPFRIEVHEGSGPPLWQAATRTLRVELPKGEVADVRLSSRLPGPDALETLGVWSWIEGACPPGWLAAAKGWALSGALWAITPARAITLVHAVQRPLLDPAFAALRATRAVGETTATLRATIDVDGKSSAKVDVVARWRDLVDDGKSLEGAVFVEREGQVASPLVDDPEAAAIDVELTHALGDTRYRPVDYDLVATSRFRENFLPTDGTSALPDLTRAAAEARRLDILSSARPAAPLIEYIVPTFGWRRHEEPDGLASRRRGQGVRIYLGRPWFSSGEGELLGVIVAHGPRVTYDSLDPAERTWLGGQVVPEPPEQLRRYVTGWGSDPIWASATTWPTPSLHHFPGKKAEQIGIRLDGLNWPSKSPWGLAVAGHEVAFDADRGLWFCDLDLDTGDAYFPFVRLALARYQPRSLAGIEVSRVVLADFIQLAPDRLAWIGADPSDPHQVRLSVSGPANRGNAASALATAIRVRVEVLTREPAEGEEARWLPADDPWQTLEQSQVTGTVALWSGEIRLPAERGALRQRIVIEEHEALPTAFGTGALLPQGTRLVYADAVEL
ncbi:MAG: hypothetical protein H6711_05290 [Myxococcales bacterium]|nr:hypothetical protein [Myxococcales bacterium]